ncbi:unnamed protein product [Discula destructiva]
MPATCYDEHSIPQPTLFPCADTGESASCCDAGNQCGSNGVCIPAEGTGAGDLVPFYINGCTSSDWTGCPKNCWNYNHGGVQACAGNQSFCCYGDHATIPGPNKGCDCQKASQVFSLAPVYPVIATDSGLCELIYKYDLFNREHQCLIRNPIRHLFCHFCSNKLRLCHVYNCRPVNT